VFVAKRDAMIGEDEKALGSPSAAPNSAEDPHGFAGA